MPADDIISILFLLVKEKQATNHYLCDYFDATPTQIEQAINQIQESGFQITVDRQSDPTYQLITPQVMYKRFVTFDQILNLYLFLTDEPKPKGKAQMRDFALRVELSELRAPYMIEFEDMKGAFLHRMIADLFLALSERKVVNLDYVDVKYDRTNRDIEPMEVFYQDQQWYVWAYCRLREDFRIFKISTTMDIHPKSEKFIRRPFTIFEGVKDPRSFRDFYFVTFELDKSLKDQLKTTFKMDKRLVTKDKIVILEKDLYSFEYAQAWLKQFGDKVKVVDPPQLKEAFEQ